MKWLLAAVWLLCSTGAIAQPSDSSDVERVRRLFQSATTHFNLGEYEPALKEFQDAYRIRQDPTLLFNIGQCYRQLHRPQDALRYYRIFLREGTPGSKREKVERLVKDLQAEIAAQPQPSPAPLPEQAHETAPALPSPPAVAPAPAPAPTPIPPPALVETPARRATQPPGAMRTGNGRAKTITGAIVAIAGLALVAGGSGAMALADREKDRLTQLDATYQMFDPALDHSWQTNRMVGPALLAIGAAATVTGAIVFSLGRIEAKRSRGARLGMR